MRDRRSYQLTCRFRPASVQESRNPRAYDLDHFKQIKDTLGHAAGNAVIAATAERLSTWAGSRAAVGRLGGDEFFSELPRASRDQVRGLRGRAGMRPENGCERRGC
ncbi:diguanylate cyclase domain-containing protein [Streptomyces clavifer]|uniref:diguanylate cyclase domain-containing protein n=1 Tax=Streptomyces clavifer TaxID=68188 RepID=UPI00382F1828